MSSTQRFFLGGLGGLLPVLASVLGVDLVSLIDHSSTLTTGNYIGYGIRVFILIFLGAIIACLNREVSNPLALVQLGIAAPALITSYINSVSATRTADLNIFPKAYASPTTSIILNRKVHGDNELILAGGLFSDIINGLSVNLGALNRLEAPSKNDASKNAVENSIASSKAAQDAAKAAEKAAQDASKAAEKAAQDTNIASSKAAQDAAKAAEKAAQDASKATEKAVQDASKVGIIGR